MTEKKMSTATRLSEQPNQSLSDAASSEVQVINRLLTSAFCILIGFVLAMAINAFIALPIAILISLFYIPCVIAHLLSLPRSLDRAMRCSCLRKGVVSILCMLIPIVILSLTMPWLVPVVLAALIVSIICTISFSSTQEARSSVSWSTKRIVIAGLVLSIISAVALVSEILFQKYVAHSPQFLGEMLVLVLCLLISAPLGFIINIIAIVKNPPSGNFTRILSLFAAFLCLISLAVFFVI